MELETQQVGFEPSLGGDTGETSGGNPQSHPTTGGVLNNPTGGGTPLDLSDDSEVRVNGKVVKYGDHLKSLQADYTKKTQAAQRLREQFEQERARHQSEIQSERKRLEGLAQELLRRQNPQGGAGDEFFNKLSTMPYVDGQTMSQFVQTLQTNGFAPIVSAIQERDKVIQGMYGELVRLSQAVKTLSSTHQTSSFESKIGKWLSDGGYPADAADWAKEVYLAYEGDDLDDEFPNILRSRWEQLQNILRAQDKARIDAARKAPRLPGKGGMGAASKMIQPRGNESAKDMADMLWEAIQTGDAT